MSEPLANGTTYPPQPSQNTILTQEIENLNPLEFFLERGSTGLKRAGGFVREDLMSELQGQLAIRTYREMRDNSATLGACCYAIEALIRNAQPIIKPADTTAEAQHYADLVKGMLLEDLQLPWNMLVSEIISFVWYGFSYFELIFKRRLGPRPDLRPDGTRPLPSKFNDGLIGIGKIAPRSQDTVLRWTFDSVGSLQGMLQIDPYAGRQAYIPYEKAMLFRPTSYKDNPEGRSILRSAYRSYYMSKNIENTEAIGIERDLTGLPLIYGPPQWFGSGASGEDLAQLNELKRIVRNVRQDEQAGLVLPSLFDPANNQLLRFELVSSAGTKAINTDTIIQRYDLRMAQSLLCDLLFLGHEDVGSFALASSKSTTQTMSMAGYLRAINDEFNRKLMPLLWRLNAFPEKMMPTLQHGDIETIDLNDLARFMLSFGRIYPMQDLENNIRRLAGLPERPGAETGPPAPPAIQPTGGGEGFHSHGGGSGTGISTGATGPGMPDLDRELRVTSV